MYKKFFFITTLAIVSSCQKNKKENNHEKTNGVLKKQEHKNKTLNIQANIFNTQILYFKNYFSELKTKKNNKTLVQGIEKEIIGELSHKTVNFLFDIIKKNSFTPFEVIDFFNKPIKQKKRYLTKIETCLKLDEGFYENFINELWEDFSQFIPQNKEAKVKIEIENLFKQLEEAYVFIKSEQSNNEKYLCTY